MIKLRYDMAKKSLKRALDRIETRKEERKHYTRARNDEEEATEHNDASMNPSSAHERTSVNPQKRATPTSKCDMMVG